MSDDGRSDRRPRVGDATLKRIDDIAEGWKRSSKDEARSKSARTGSGTPADIIEPDADEFPTEEDDAVETPSPPAPRLSAPRAGPEHAPRAEGKPAAARPARKSEPPPPPGSPERAKRDSQSPPGSPERAKRDSQSPPAAGSGLATAAKSSAAAKPVEDPATASARSRAVRASEPPPTPGAPRAQRRSAPPPVPTDARPTPSSEPGRYDGAPDYDPPPAEKRAETANHSDRPRRSSRPPSAHPPAAAAEARAQAAIRKAQRATGGLRMPTEVPASRGPLGDIGYAVSAAISLRAARRELAAIERKLRVERDARRERLIELGRQAIADPSVEIPVIDKARQTIVDIEERRSRKAGKVAALDAELEAIESERKRREEAHRNNVGAVEDDIAVVVSELEPLEQHLALLRHRTGELKSAIRLLDQKIEKHEAKLIEAQQPGNVPHEMEADIAAMRAERDSLAREGPDLSDKISEMEPEIAGLKASRAELEANVSELQEIAKDAAERTREKVEAVTARKLVDDREVADVARERQRALRELGASLHDLRPDSLEPRLRGIDQHDEAITTLERRAIELKDKLLRANKKSMMRGFFYLFALGLVGAVVAILIAT